MRVVLDTNILFSAFDGASHAAGPHLYRLGAEQIRPRHERTPDYRVARAVSPRPELRSRLRPSQVGRSSASFSRAQKKNARSFPNGRCHLTPSERPDCSPRLLRVVTRQLIPERQVGCACRSPRKLH